MQYQNIRRGVFLDRPNRFVAHVEIGGLRETVHVKNTGRCRELLIPGREVILSHSDSPSRKTAYDLIAVEKPGLGLVNIDSQAPNHVMKEWLLGLDFDLVRPEFSYGSSRIDFYMERRGRRYLTEVKGCTLEIGGIGYFPDAPTERGLKHLHELARARQEGFLTSVAFVNPMGGVTKVLPNMETHPAFGIALSEAEAAGVQVLYLPCLVGEDRLEIDGAMAEQLNPGFLRA